jgi:nitrate reductase beta subunit
MYRLLAIAKYDDRYVIPKAHVEQAHDLENLACSLDTDGGPGMGGPSEGISGMGPVRKLGKRRNKSGAPSAVARFDVDENGVERFHDLQSLTDEPAHGAGEQSPPGRLNLLNWNGNTTAPGLFPPVATDGPS